MKLQLVRCPQLQKLKLGLQVCALIVMRLNR
jgi:hypothetical protein